MYPHGQTIVQEQETGLYGSELPSQAQKFEVVVAWGLTYHKLSQRDLHLICRLEVSLLYWFGPDCLNGVVSRQSSIQLHRMS